MKKREKNKHKDKRKSFLIALSVLLFLVGSMIIDPFAGLICFALAAIMALAACFTAKRWVRYTALFLLVVAAILIIFQFSQARDHYLKYRDKSVYRNTN